MNFVQRLRQASDNNPHQLVFAVCEPTESAMLYVTTMEKFQEDQYVLHKVCCGDMRFANELLMITTTVSKHFGVNFIVKSVYCHGVRLPRQIFVLEHAFLNVLNAQKNSSRATKLTLLPLPSPESSWANSKTPKDDETLTWKPPQNQASIAVFGSSSFLMAIDETWKQQCKTYDGPSSSSTSIAKEEEDGSFLKEEEHNKYIPSNLLDDDCTTAKCLGCQSPLYPKLQGCVFCFLKSIGDPDFVFVTTKSNK